MYIPGLYAHVYVQARTGNQDAVDKPSSKRSSDIPPDIFFRPLLFWKRMLRYRLLLYYIPSIDPFEHLHQLSSDRSNKHIGTSPLM
ncbi:unnamed protein product [Periconia digitata]|uniref:Uncharacterized protein n=1 Tax=Periconia digitata TaxID=1303443 RepID=A0A9W4URK9_9PLEO|nr:unnamed protein product [Periconia digitata]